jgi:hypothetical protein
MKFRSFGFPWDCQSIGRGKRDGVRVRVWEGRWNGVRKGIWARIRKGPRTGRRFGLAAWRAEEAGQHNQMVNHLNM